MDDKKMGRASGLLAYFLPNELPLSAVLLMLPHMNRCDLINHPRKTLRLPACLALLFACASVNAVERYVSLQGGHAPPFTNWVAAATNIQAAIDVAADGDVVWVTNGVYATGGKVKAGDLTNRVALDRAVAVRSVNGPQATVIQGQKDAVSGNGPGAVRCVWLTNGAVLSGFTVRGGATRSAGNTPTLQSGGGVWCISTNAIVANCVITGNSASWFAGGSFGGTLNNCTFTTNSAIYGGGSCSNTLNNCTLTDNSAQGGGGCHFGTLNNCIVWGNQGYVYDGGLLNYASNYNGSTLNYSCTSPLASGTGNIAIAPQFLADGLHIAATAPCRGAGSTNYATGTDIDGQPWANPPSMGCDEWWPDPVIIVGPRRLPSPDAGQIILVTTVVGQEPFVCWWTKDGVAIEDGPHYGGAHSTNLLIRGFGPDDAGAYQVVVSNAFGMATSPVVQLTIHCVDAKATAPVAPYTNWATAATNIQDAIDVASAGDVVWVTNGVYATAGKVMAGDLTNRVALDKAVTVLSVNGAQETVIQGQWNAVVPNGPGAVRCAWLTNGAELRGFTLRGGGTRSDGDENTLRNGGGVWCASTNAMVANCVITGNSAYQNGGGSYSGTLNNCRLAGNSASWGVGGGSCFGMLNNCTLTHNSSWYGYGGSYYDTLNNCIAWDNQGANYSGSTLNYSCASPLASGTGNIAIDPQLLADGVHISATSPCRGTGSTNYVTGTDIDGQLWANPPSMGCDDWQPAPIIIVGPRCLPAPDASQVRLVVTVGGQEPFDYWWTKDGVMIEDGLHYGGAHSTNLLIRGFGLDDSGAYQMVVSNAFGMATSRVVRLSIHFVDAKATAPLAPYTNWITAATNIQDAIDMVSDGGVVWVTNGIYASGGKVIAGDLTNRVALDKGLAVLSVNGPQETVIQGQWDVVNTNGPGAVRCAWLTDGAVLSGFTLRGGATRSAGDNTTLLSGGGVWCASTNALVTNCVITGNSATDSGGGSYSGTLNKCTFTTNSASFGGGGCYSTLNKCILSRNSAPNGGGSAAGTLNNCTLTANSATSHGGGSYSGTLNNCRLTGNSASSPGGGGAGGGSYSDTLNNCTLTRNFGGVGAGGAYYSTLSNCIVWGNTCGDNVVDPNFYAGTLRYSCAPRLADGPGNIDTDPQFLADGVHIAATSPCRGAGSTNYVTGTDIDGQPWASPPSMGCDEWRPDPVIIVAPRCLPAPVAGQAILVTSVAGQEPFDYWWTKDGGAIEDGAHYGGAHSTNLLMRGFGPDDAGAYQVVVSNAFGMVTSQVARLTIHCVDAKAATPLAPYTNWAAAATNIQDAIDVAADGDVIWVTNGIYSAGGKVMAGDLTNRVALDKAVTVSSVNGAQETVIQGQRDAVSTNGPGAVRCAWLTDGAVLTGFTLRGGATRSTGDSTTLRSGGGVWCVSTYALVANCGITGNSARYGGGSYSGTLNNCKLTGNSASTSGGGSYSGTLNNCTLTANSAAIGGGSVSSTLNNCILWANGASSSGQNYSGSTLNYTCSSPLASGTGNIAIDPQFLADGVHIAAASPCRGAGSTNYVTGTDIDGQPWASPPSMGCDEWQPDPVIIVGPRCLPAPVAGQAILVTSVAGQEPFDYWWTKDGGAIEDGAHYGGAHSTNLLMRGFGPDDAGAYLVVVSNAFGMATSQVVRLTIHCVDAKATAPLAPYTNWVAAATNIQDAIDVASDGDVVWVTNGIYATGGKVMAGDLTNRAALNKAVTVSSVNGPQETVIQGQWNAVGTNGPGAVRCAWLTDGAVLTGFILRGGATRSAGDTTTLRSGGGVWCVSTYALVANCIITGNSASQNGGGSYFGTLNNCTLTGNSASSGGGSYSGTLNNCTLTANSASFGGGCNSGTLNNCRLTGNSAPSGGGCYSGRLNNCGLTGNSATIGGGCYSGTLNNCILWTNGASSSGPNYSGSTLRYTCSSPLASGTGNIAIDPQSLADGMHIAATSLCRGAGSTNYVTGTDIDGQLWTNPPSMGCDEWHPEPVIGLQPQTQTVSAGTNVTLAVVAAGQLPLSYQWQFNSNKITGATNATLTLTNVPVTAAGEYVCVVTNTLGSVTSAVAKLTVNRQPVRFDTSAANLRMTNGGFQMRVTGLAGQGTSVIYASTNLVDWEGIFTNPPFVGTLNFLDPAGTNLPLRFYKAVEGP